MLYLLTRLWVATDIGDAMPSGPDYKGVSFLTGPTKQLIGNGLAVLQILSLVVIVIAGIAYISSKRPEAAQQWASWLKRGAIGLIAASAFNWLITGTLSFFTGVIGA